MKEVIRLLGLFKPYAGWILAGILVSYITLMANVALMSISGWFIATMAISGVLGVSVNYFTPGAMIRTFAIMRTVGRYVERLITHEATFRLLSQLRVWFYERLEPLAPAKLQFYRGGDLLSRIAADIDTLNHFYLGIVLPFAVGMLAILTFFIVLLFYSPALALIEVGLLLTAGVILPWLMSRMTAKAAARSVVTASELRSVVVDSVQGINELAVYGASGRYRAQMASLGKRLAGDQAVMARASGYSQGAVLLSANLAMWMIVITVIPQVNDEIIPPAELAMLALFALASFESVAPLPVAFSSVGETLAAARRIFEIADEVADIQDPTNPLPLPNSFHYRLEQVSFKYTASDEYVLQAVDIDLSEGKKIAVVGPTGCGKTSLIQLLMRFWQPNEGRITLNGHALENYSAEHIRRNIAVASQHSHLFNATLRQNLLIAKPEASLEALDHVCEIAQLSGFIEALESGYDTSLGEAGQRVSGGEAQRISIARALLKEASLLVLDEPLEGLDPKIARNLMASVLDNLEGRALLLITHNLRGLQHMDEIIVMQQGRIVERGTHDVLLKAGGAYTALYEMQITA